MRPVLLLLALAFVVLSSDASVRADEDPRTDIALPAHVADAFMAEMRTHMGNLDDIVSAIADGDFMEAAVIAAHNMSTRYKAMRDPMGRLPGMGQGMGQGVGMGVGPGFGRYMPEDFRAMGAQFHAAAETFATVAATVTAPASTADYQVVIGALRDVTTACRACHDAYRISGISAKPVPK